MDAGPWANVHQVIGGPDGVFVVLDHDQGVAQVPQAVEGVEQAIVVALVEANAGLVEHVEHPRQPRTDLGGEANALGFAAGEGHGGAVQSQVVEPDIDHKLEAGANFSQHQGPNLQLPGRELGGLALFPHQIANARQALANGDVGEVADRVGANAHGVGLGLEPGAVAHLAGLVDQVLLELLLVQLGGGVLILPLEDGQNPFVLALVALAIAVAGV